MKKMLAMSAIVLTCLGFWAVGPSQAMAQDEEPVINLDDSGFDDSEMEMPEFNFETEFDEYGDDGSFEPSAGEAAAVGGAIFCMLAWWGLCFLLSIVALIGMWKMFAKAGEPGWAAIIPFFNTYILCKICGKDIVWFILTLIPCINVVVAIILMIELAKAFGKGGGFALGLILFSPIFIAILGFGSAQYQGVKAA